MHPKEHSLFGAVVASTPVVCSDVLFSGGNVANLNISTSPMVDLLCPGFLNFNNILSLPP
jgi:hypothetical protein